jgi:hypothetical protein
MNGVKTSLRLDLGTNYRLISRIIVIAGKGGRLWL